MALVVLLASNGPADSRHLGRLSLGLRLGGQQGGRHV